MQSTTKWFLGLALGAATLATTFTAFAAPAPAAPAPAAPERGEIRALLRTGLAEAGFSPMQKAEAALVLRRHAPSVMPLIRQLVQERRALRELMRADPLDEGALRAQSGRIGQLQSELHLQAARATQDVRRLATPEQLARVRQLEQEVRAQMDAGFQALEAWLARS